MILLPIGTRSSTVLRPVVTLGLMAINVLIAAVTLPMDHRASDRLFQVQRERYALEIQLRGIAYREQRGTDPIFETYFQRATDHVRRAHDAFDLDLALFEATQLLEIDAEEFVGYQETLASLHVDDALDPRYPLLHEWKALAEREDRIRAETPPFALGLIPARMDRIHTFFTHQFVHADLLHLFGNLLFLWMVGGLLEDTWGRGPFLVFYLLAGAAAGLIHSLQDASSTMPLIGASGAIAGAMGAFAVRHFQTRIRMFYFFLMLFRPYWGVFYVPAFVFLPLWFGQQMLLKSVATWTGATDVAYLAHIGGFLAGLVIALALRGFGVEDRLLAPRVVRKRVQKGALIDPRFDEAWMWLRDGHAEKGRAQLYEMLRERPDDLDLKQDVANAFRQCRFDKDYQRVSDQLLGALLRRARAEEAASLVLDAVSGPEQVQLDPLAMIKVARWLREEERYVEAAGVLRSIIGAEVPAEARGKAVLALVDILSEDLDQPRDALWILENCAPGWVDEAWQERVDEQIARVRRRLEPAPANAR